MKIYMKNPTGINWSSCAYHIKLSLLEAARLKITVLIKAVIRIIYNRLINPSGLLGVTGHYHPVLHVTCQSLVDYNINMPESSKCWNWTQYRCQRREEKKMDHTCLVMTVFDYQCITSTDTEVVIQSGTDTAVMPLCITITVSVLFWDWLSSRDKLRRTKWGGGGGGGAVICKGKKVVSFLCMCSIMSNISKWCTLG